MLNATHKIHDLWSHLYGKLEFLVQGIVGRRRRAAIDVPPNITLEYRRRPDEEVPH